MSPTAESTDNPLFMPPNSNYAHVIPGTYRPFDSKTCPNCGYCEACGRPNPWVRQPWVPTWNEPWYVSPTITWDEPNTWTITQTNDTTMFVNDVTS